MKIFVTDKYRIFTFCLICILITASAFIVNKKTALPVLSEKRILPIYSVSRDDKSVAITFDCAWGADDIDQIINVLEKHNCKATFFVLGTWAEDYPDSIKKLHSAGHEIGNHSYNHDYYTKLTETQMLENIEKCNNIIENLTGTRPTLFRAPAGDYNNTVVETAEKANMKYIQWNIDSLDWKGLTKSEMLERIIPRLEGGSILLFHNGTKNTAQSLDEILGEIQKKGYKFLKTSELIYTENYSIDHTGKQIKN